MRAMLRRLLWLVAAVLLAAGCSSGSGGNGNGDGGAPPRQGWVEDEVTFTADGLTIYGTYRHQADAAPGPAALLISESGNTDRNGDNAVAGPVGNMRQLAEYLSGKGIATLRYDKVGTGKTGLGPYALRPTEVGSAVYDLGAKAAIRYLAGQPGSTRRACRSTPSARAPCTPCRWPTTALPTHRRSTRWGSFSHSRAAISTSSPGACGPGWPPT